ncbi:MAG: hypothetical protein ACJASU_001008 [Cognaticolwellia sp.]
MFKGTLLTHKYQRERALTKFEMEMVEETAHVYKQRLIDISWFMWALLQHLSNRVLPVLNFVSKQPSWESNRPRYYLLLAMNIKRKPQVSALA